MADREQLNRLSCSRCKERKVRCNRVMPHCSRCKAHDAECVYPVRAKRRSTRPLAVHQSMPTNAEDALVIILDRLNRLEAQYPAQPSSQTLPSTANCSPASSSPAALYTPGYHDPCDAPPRVGIDATAILKNAVDQVRDLRLRGLATAVITDGIDIPVDLAKYWIRNYLDHMPVCMFLSFVDKRTIQLIPDVLGLPHIHIDPGILVIYYCILYYGCTLRASNESSNASISYARLTYLACMRAIPGWQREATGTLTDLIAALFLTRIAHQFFDEELAWKMFRHACEYCHALNLHKLDSADYPENNQNSSCDCDSDRKGFWEVLQADLYFRLILNKPPILSRDTWSVNLPWLDANSQPPPEGIRATAFIASSRVTLVIIRFFALLDDPDIDTKAETMTKTEDLGHEILQIFAEWQLNEWMDNAPDQEADLWEVADVLLTGYTAIIYMFRKMAVLDSNSPEPVTTELDIPESPVVTHAARSTIKIMCRLMFKVPYVETLVTLFGAYRSYVAYSYLANTLLRASDLRQHMVDVKALEQLGNQAELLAKGQSDIFPLVRAMQNLNAEVRRRCNQQEA
ncbi:hypothetical protein B0J13DRAFT_546336 [Dactylonectria estremocensis]|uniref:Zn(2)-C6 fungal-type domain-containing protein n=1 Tax=Dactylonectria estremocensis TaxID=1079267 RepID=A0A9P9F9G2_9HYPO|nr:hypothetical protein B0J13DRAFT_546336 [Dactylonectria estremocensis]